MLGAARLGEAAAAIRGRRRLSLGLFVYVFAAQLGHLIEHISVALRGAPLLGSQFDSEVSHLVFNGLIAVLALALVAVFPRNPWVYPLATLSVFHSIEHVYIFEQWLRTGIANGPGLLGQGGAFGLIPLPRVDLHNVYNGLEVVLLAAGFWNEVEAANDKMSGETEHA